MYTGWIMLDGVQYCFDETGHPRTGTYQEDGKVWELDSDGRVKNRLNGWKKTDGVLKYYDNSGAPAQGWTEIDGKDYFFVDGVSQAGWVETDAGTRYLDGNGNQMTGWCVIDGQPMLLGQMENRSRDGIIPMKKLLFYQRRQSVGHIRGGRT